LNITHFEFFLEIFFSEELTAMKLTAVRIQLKRRFLKDAVKMTKNRPKENKTG
jgi:hypothetical protein